MTQDEELPRYEEFYHQVANLLHTIHVFKEPRRYLRRWGDRTPGNGRFPGHGIVRVFAPQDIHVALYEPVLTGTFKSFASALEAIGQAVATA